MKTKWLAAMVLGAFACGTPAQEDSDNPTTGGKADTTQSRQRMGCDLGLPAVCVDTESGDPGVLALYLRYCEESGGKVFEEGCPKARLGGCQQKNSRGIMQTEWFDTYSVTDRRQIAAACEKGGGVFISSSWPKFGCDVTDPAVKNCTDYEAVDAAVLSRRESSCTALGGKVLSAGCPRSVVGGCEMVESPVKVILTQWYEDYPGLSFEDYADVCTQSGGKFVLP